MLLARASRRHLEALRYDNAAPGTLSNYAMVESALVTWLSQSLGRAPSVADLTLEAVRAYQRYLTDSEPGRRSVGTVRYYLTVLRSWCSWMVEDEILPEHPLLKLRKPRAPKLLPKFPNPKQVDALLALCARTANPPRNEALIHFMADTGVRVSEACGLRLEDVTFWTPAEPQGQARIVGKGSKERIVTFGRDTSRLLTECLRRGPRDKTAPWLFQRDDCRGPLDRKWIDALLKRLADLGDLPRDVAHAHGLRHAYGVEATLAGVPLVALQKLMGHADISQTALYVQLSRVQVVGAAISPMDHRRQQRQATRR